MPATAAGPSRPNPVQELAAWATARHNSSLVLLLALSLGLGLVAPQVEQLWVLIVFSVVWGVTLFAFAAQFWGRREQARPGGRHAA
ncbi:hypothetical protein ACIQBJ_03210 [Kitasatospora sp. NPDC088391]|uniref:hypothetical protein n=1 Tax=Kitasatospora sp. NPDC088391 TaxID=3364074 RepID=UPI00380FD399